MKIFWNITCYYSSR